MSSQSSCRGPLKHAGWVAVTAMLAASTSLAGQALPLRATDPATVPYECAPWSPPQTAEPGAPEQAREIASEAARATVLGDLERARTLLARALDLDGSSADLRYRYARALEALGERAEAIKAFCQVRATGGEHVDLVDVAHRIDSLAAVGRIPISDSARMAFAGGVASARAGHTQAALESFNRAASLQPDWPAARYNLGVVLDRAGAFADAEEQLRHYLTLDPDAADGVAVSRRIGQLQAAGPSAQRSRGTALALGLAVPGLGQFYSGRTRVGLAVLATVGGVVAFGLLDKRVNVRCVRPPADGAGCPPEEVVTRQTVRPYLRDALVAGGVLAVVAALEAVLNIDGDRSTSDPADSFPPVAERLRAGPNGASSLVLLRVPVR